MHIHILGICGTFMGGIALIASALGHQVSGSDANVYPPMSDFLAGKGIDVWKGFHADNLAHAPDLVVVGNAVSRGNPEVEKMMAAGLCFCSMPQAVNRLVAAGRPRPDPLGQPRPPCAGG